MEDIEQQQALGGGESGLQEEPSDKTDTKEPVEARQAPLEQLPSANIQQDAVATVDQQPKDIVVTENGAATAKSSEPHNNTTDWKRKEKSLLEKIEHLETVQTDTSTESLKLQLKVREEEVELLRARVTNLETELQAALSKPGSKNHEMIENIKQQHEELLSKARGMIFDKTKMVKNQELQIQALTTQVASLKDINLITKDLLEIRNSEVAAMEERLLAMEARIKAEKEHHALQMKQSTASAGLNEDLKREYDTQLALFKQLRVKYDDRVKALVAENEKLKDVMKTREEAAAAAASTG